MLVMGRGWHTAAAMQTSRQSIATIVCVSTPRAEVHATKSLAYKEEEEGYYYGFANEGLWPLCHIAHTRPMFRVSDWEHYCQGKCEVCESCTGRDGRALNSRYSWFRTTTLACCHVW